MSTKHTPGPWGAFHGSVIAKSITYSNSRSNRVCHIEREGTPSSEVDANANLIASAPELLEALKEALALIGSMSACGFGLIETHNKWSDIVAKAEGRKP